MKLKYSIVALAAPFLMNAQQVMTPEILWSLNRLGVETVSPSQSELIYKLSKTDIQTEKTKSEIYFLNLLNGGASHKIDLGKI